MNASCWPSFLRSVYLHYHCWWKLLSIEIWLDVSLISIFYLCNWALTSVYCWKFAHVSFYLWVVIISYCYSCQTITWHIWSIALRISHSAFSLWTGITLEIQPVLETLNSFFQIYVILTKINTYYKLFVHSYFDIHLGNWTEICITGMPEECTSVACVNVQFMWNL